ncbi:hypothetical protein H310_04742 [Aphanomyces invadans]|uniref:Uncharacterized protein n=1 Tax=Aphanomyces invadans TaxID=157072 RepID=A0A024UFT1_9STRA|nr:hypothetical protein H310_04742 [Aphanomyces invadans]ETW04468.1 hypothetical protein H310_04742 [Aphanomyces invadans]|eukprot:XP_008867424.1 hypothetical protein H310_04742 [Aphanomyces invadans]
MTLWWCKYCFTAVIAVLAGFLELVQHNTMQVSIVLVTIVAAVSTPVVVAVGCTQGQKVQMLDAITKHPSWPACQQATLPFDFYLALTQEGPSPTTNDLTKFKANTACNAVYASFQDSMKQANCDEVADLVGIPVDQLVPPTAATTSAAAPLTTQANSLVPPAGAATVKPTLPASPTTTGKSAEAMAGRVQPSLAAASATMAISAMTLAVVALL